MKKHDILFSSCQLNKYIFQLMSVVFKNLNSIILTITFDGFMKRVVLKYYLQILTIPVLFSAIVVNSHVFKLIKSTKVEHLPTSYSDPVIGRKMVTKRVQI